MRRAKWRLGSSRAADACEVREPEAPAEQLRIGPCMGSFDRASLLGRGGHGEVHRALHVDLQIEVAVKLLPRERLDALREPRIVAGLGFHPHVMPVLALGTHEDWAYVVMPLAAGSLSQLIRREGPRLPVAMALEIARQVAEGLVVTHRKGLVHSDVKPGNIFFAEDEPGRRRYMLADFGLARPARSLGGRVAGTPLYMSPEVWAGKADARADLWALAVMLHQMLAGELPWSPDLEVGALLQRIVAHQRRPLSQLAPDLPAPVVALVERALSSDPEERFQSATELRDALCRLELELGLLSEPATALRVLGESAEPALVVRGPEAAPSPREQRTLLLPQPPSPLDIPHSPDVQALQQRRREREANREGPPARAGQLSRLYLHDRDDPRHDTWAERTPVWLPAAGALPSSVAWLGEVTLGGGTA